MGDLPQEVQDQESATFDFGKVRTLLLAGYYRGPAENDDDSRGGLRAAALRGNPATHRTSILRKAVETNLLEETPDGYATTPHGFELLQQMMICEDCGGDQSAFITGIPTGRHSGYAAIITVCPSCRDNPTSSTNVSEFERSEESLREAIRAMESHDVVCYLNGKSVNQVKDELGI